MLGIAITSFVPCYAVALYHHWIQILVVRCILGILYAGLHPALSFQWCYLRGSGATAVAWEKEMTESMYCGLHNSRLEL